MNREQPTSAIAGVGDLLADWSTARRATATAVQSLLREIPRVRDSVAAIRGLPDFPLDLTDSPEGRDIMSSYLGRRRGIPKSLAVSMLALPHEPDDYLRGDARESVRTNWETARAAGLTYLRPRSRDEAIGFIYAVADRALDPETRSWLTGRVQRRRGEIRCVADDAGTPIALIHFTVDRDVSRLDLGVSTESEVTSLGRYLLSAELFVELARREVRFALADSDLIASRSIRYFKQRLGFEPVNVRLGRLPDWIHERPIAHDPAPMPVPG